MLIAVLIGAVVLVAFTNGANANFKGVASLYGSGTTSLRTAALWGTATTFAGSLTASFLVGGLVAAFSGRGLVPDDVTRAPDFLCAVALGGAATSFLATRLGFPVSTTHALVGALIGAGLLAGEVQFAALGKVFLYPLFFSPLVAAALGALLYVLGMRYLPTYRTPALDTGHFLATGAASFARGLNDTPKIVAPLLIVPDLSINGAFLIVAVSIALGGLLDIKNVAETLGKKVTGLNPGQGLTVALVTAGLVSTATLHSMPVSTTHVSVGSLCGMGGITGQAHWRKVGEIVLAWVCTVPCGAALAALAYLVVTRLT